MILLHDPMTTKTKKPSSTGPTGQSFPFLVVVSGTNPLLVMFFSNFSTFLSARRLDVVYTKPKFPHCNFNQHCKNQINKTNQHELHSITQGRHNWIWMAPDPIHKLTKHFTIRINNHKIQKLIRCINNYNNNKTPKSTTL